MTVPLSNGPSAPEMAAFDPIELFGIGHDRENAIVLPRARSPSQSTISLSSVSFRQHQPQHTSLLERPTPQGLPEYPIETGLRSPEHAFANITPEDSLDGASIALDNTPVPTSPNVSLCSGWSSNTPDQPFALRQYIRNHERHEALLLALSSISEVPRPSASSTLSTLPYSNCSRGTRERHEAVSSPRGDEMGHNGSDEPSATSPLRRYLSEAQTYEQVALGLFLYDEARQESESRSETATQDTASDTEIGHEDGSRSSKEQAVPANISWLSLKLQKARMERDARRLRSRKAHRVRKWSESPPRGRQSKMGSKRSARSSPEGRKHKMPRPD
ncbi:hypothetical protein VTH82DRAFT_6050 [Thermothelomyces myriococcoides]